MALVMCAVLAFAGQSSVATGTTASDFEASKWSEWNYRTVHSKFGDWWGTTGRSDKFGNNCFMFARLVVYTLTNGEINFNQQTDGLRGIVGLSGSRIAQHFNDGGNYLSADGVKRTFQNAQVGDVVQMYWNSTPHTFIISYKDDYGVQVLQSNTTSAKVINNTYYTWSELAKAYKKPSGSGGFSIYNLGIRPNPETPPVVTYAPIENLVAGQYYSLQCQANGSVSSWTLTGTLPPGLSFNSQTGEISGTVESTARGMISYNARKYNYSVTAKNSGGTSRSRTGYIGVYDPPVFITDSPLSDGEIGVDYRQEIEAYGTEWSMQWKVIGSLPPGLTFNGPNNSRKAVISGKPTAAGVYTFKVHLENFMGNPETTAEKEYTITIGKPLMWIKGYFKPGAVVEQYYSSAIKLYVRSAMAMSRWESKSPRSTVFPTKGWLPSGMKLRETTDLRFDDEGDFYYIYLEGTPLPSRSSTYSFVVEADNGYRGPENQALSPLQNIIVSKVGPNPNMSILYTFRDGQYKVNYRDYVLISGGQPPYTVSKISGELPTGIGIYSYGSYIYLLNTPGNYGDYEFTLRATDANGGYTDKTFQLRIKPNSAYDSAGVGEEPSKPSKPKLATKKIPDATTYSEYRVELEAGGTAPITWSFEGNLPEGFISTDSGVIFGVATETGKYKFKATATNSEGSKSKSFTLKVLPQKPSITTTAIPDGVIGESYDFTIDTEGDEIKFSKSGKFPKGLKLDKITGEITGVPTKAGTYTFTARAKNKAGKASAEFTIVIHEEAAGEETVNASAVRNAAVRAGVSSTEELYLLHNGAEIDDSASVSAGTPLTFRAGDLPDDDEDDAPDYSGLRVYVDDEEAEGVSVAPDGTFTLPGELVQGSFTVYAAGRVDGQEVETAEIDIETASDPESDSFDDGDSSGACSVNLAGMFMLLMSGIVLLKKK